MFVSSITTDSSNTENDIVLEVRFCPTSILLEDKLAKKFFDEAQKLDKVLSFNIVQNGTEKVVYIRVEDAPVP